jgi:hypothetical protein
MYEDEDYILRILIKIDSHFATFHVCHSCLNGDRKSFCDTLIDEELH